MPEEKKNYKAYIHNIRPDKMPNDGINYWPKGIDKKPILRTEYVDESGNKFYICYSKQQLKNLSLMIFTPYIPLAIFNCIFNFRR